MTSKDKHATIANTVYNATCYFVHTNRHKDDTINNGTAKAVLFDKTYINALINFGNTLKNNGTTN